MWIKIILILWAIILACDVAWVLTNVKYGIYKGFIDGVVTSRVAIGFIWLLTSLIIALNISAILYYMPLKRAFYGSLFFGFSIYLLFNATILIFFKWSPYSAIGDVLWGTALCGIAGLIGTALVKKWKTIEPSVLHPASLR